MSGFLYAKFAVTALRACILGPLGEPPLPKIFSVFSVSSVVNHPQILPAEDFGEDEGGDDGGVGFDDEFRGFFAEFAPGDFFVGHGA